MSWWVRDQQGRVFGPTTEAVVRELIAAGRLRDVSAASRDGQTWSPIAAQPEFAGLFSRPARADDDGPAQAAALRTRLDSLRGRPAHEVFGVPAGSGPDELRRAYLPLVKNFHPARLPPDVHPELRAASVEMFQFLGRVMAESQRGGEVSSPSAPPPAPARPTWSLDEFVGFDRREDGRVVVNIRVSVATVGMFTEHPVVNLSRGGLFVATPTPPDLGTTLDFRLRFDDPPRQIEGRARVAWASMPGGRARPGMGLTFIQLEKADLHFLEEFVRGCAEAAARKG